MVHQHLTVQRPDGKFLRPKISGMGGNLRLVDYANQTKVFLRTEKTGYQITIVTVPPERGCKLLYRNKIVAHLNTENLNKVFKVKVEPVRKPSFKPRKISMFGREIPCSIVIPTYNMENMLKKTLTALLKQSPEEVIVVDDGSNDGTQEMIKSQFPSVRYFYQERKGRRQQKALNKGLKEATNDCVIVLDADCEPQSDFIKAHKYYFRSVIVQVGLVYPQNKDSKIRNVEFRERKFLDKSEFDKIGTGNLCFSRSRVLSIGGFTEAYGGAWGYANQDFAHKVTCLLDVRIQINPDAHVIHQYHPTQQTAEGLKRNSAIFKRKLKEYKVQSALRKEQLKILTIIDTYGWAYDVGCRGLYKELRKQHPDWVLDTCLYKEVEDDYVDARNYDMVFVWAWWNFDSNTKRFYPWVKLLEKLNPNNTILCVAGEYHLPYLRNGLEQIRRFKFRYMAGNNANIARKICKMGIHDKVFTLDFGVDLDTFKPTPFPKEFTVGWVGHQGRKLKRYEMAVTACRKAGVPLRVAGHIYGKNYIPPSQMPSFYGNISCLLITSESEAHPLIYPEALASGRPVVSTLVGDIPKTARDGKNGFYLPVKCTPNQLAEKLQRLRENPELLKAMGAQARMDAEQLWSWEKISKSYVDAVNVIRLLGTPFFSACMLVSRDNELMERAVASLARQKPTEFIAYIDPVMLPDQTRAREILTKAGAKIRVQQTTNVEDHHEDVVHSVHRMLLEAKYPRVLTLDDDDEIIGDVRDLVPLVKGEVAKIVGGVRRRWVSGREEDVPSRTVESKKDINHIWGSFAIYNRNIFRKVHGNVDHGYFWDWKIDYWLWRASYQVKAVNRITSIQNINPAPSAKRKSLYSAWPSILEELDKQKLRIKK